MEQVGSEKLASPSSNLHVRGAIPKCPSLGLRSSAMLEAVELENLVNDDAPDLLEVDDSCALADTDRVDGQMKSRSSWQTPRARRLWRPQHGCNYTGHQDAGLEGEEAAEGRPPRGVDR